MGKFVGRFVLDCSRFVTPFISCSSAAVKGGLLCCCWDSTLAAIAEHRQTENISLSISDRRWTSAAAISNVANGTVVAVSIAACYATGVRIRFFSSFWCQKSVSGSLMRKANQWHNVRIGLVWRRVLNSNTESTAHSHNSIVRFNTRSAVFSFLTALLSVIYLHGFAVFVSVVYRTDKYFA